MISAMPAVAVRRGRKKSTTFGRFSLKQPSSHHSSITSLSRNRSFSKRGGHQGVSTIGSVNARFRYRSTNSEIDKQRRRFLIYLGTLCLVTGLLVVFIGVGAAVPSAQTVGLLLIGVGALLCMIKVFYSEVEATKVAQKLPVTNDESEESTDLASPGSKDITPVAEVSELAGHQSQPRPGSRDSAIGNSHNNTQTNSTVTPSDIPETQVLIPEGSERY